MQRAINPYIAGNPVGNSSAFIGRTDVLREVTRVLRQPQSNAIVLYGQRRIGKTSILQYLEGHLPDEGPYRAVYFDLQDKAEWPLERVLRILAQTIAQALEQPEPDLGQDGATAFHTTWLPATLDTLPIGCSLVLLFDEFDVLSDPQGEQAAKAFFPYLRDLLGVDPARLQFVFVIGRNVGDLNAIALSLFKGTPYRRVSLLDENDTAALARLSEANGTLRWPDDVVSTIWTLTHGHPFLTQQLCSHVWEAIYDAEPDGVPIATPDDVENAVSDALQASENALEWLWNGLGPAERVVASALAEAGPEAISQEALEQLLQESGVRVLIRELQNAPELLQEWDIVEPDNGGFRFRVELLRRWIAERKPLKRVQDELDRIQPVADNLYRAAWSIYNGGQFEQAVPLLRQAIGFNPNHVGANQLLADILLAQEQPQEAQELLQRLYAYHPAAARPRLVQALLAQATVAEDDDIRLEFYEQVLAIAPANPEATIEKRRIWEQRGDQASVKSIGFEKALEAYKIARLPDKIAATEKAIRQRDIAAGQSHVGILEQEGKYAEALRQARELAEHYPEHDWSAEIKRLAAKTNLENLYTQALDALKNGETLKAQNLLVEVVKLEPAYKETTRHLHYAVTGVDVAELSNRLDKEVASHNQTHTRLVDVQTQSDTYEKTNQHLKQRLEESNHMLQQFQAKPNQPWWKYVPKWAWCTGGAWLIALAVAGFVLGMTIGSGSQPTIPSETTTPSPILTVNSTTIATPHQSVGTTSPTVTPTAPTNTPTATSTPSPTATPPAATPPAATPTLTSTTDILTPTIGYTWTRPTDGMVMVYVPAGTFQMGSDNGDDDEKPVHTVTLDAFWMDRTEVTVAQFVDFLNVMGNQNGGGVSWLDIEDEDCLIQEVGGEFQFKNDYAGHPVIEVSWYGAQAYCAWAGAQLPTEAQWEYAARGPKNLIYPWGNDWTEKIANCTESVCKDGYDYTAPVGSFPEGASWIEALDMAGNVWEWVADWYGTYPSEAQDNPTGPDSGESRLLRGGSWYDFGNIVRTTNRYGNSPTNTYDNVGFRCVAVRQD